MKSIRCRLRNATWCEYFRSGECTSQVKCEYQTEHMSATFPETIFMPSKEAWEKMQAENSRLTAENAELRERLNRAVDDYIEFCKEVGNTNKVRVEISIDDVWRELEDGDETKSVSTGLLVGKLIAAIISARHKQKLSQADLAQKMNVSVSCIRRMERLNSMPRIDTVFQAALVLGVLNAKWWKADD